MAKRKSTPPEMPRVLDFNEIANVLTYLNEQHPKTPSVADDQYSVERADDLDHGRFLLNELLVEHLRYAEYTHREELREVIADNVKLREAAAREATHG